MTIQELEWLGRGGYNHYGKNRIFRIQEGKGENLLILQGLGTTSKDWNAVLDSLSEKYTILLPDLLGIGYSDKPKRHRYSITDSVNQIEYLLKKKKLKSFHILAHDIGLIITYLLIKKNERNELKFKILSVFGIIDENFGKPRPYYILGGNQKLVRINFDQFLINSTYLEKKKKFKINTISTRLQSKNKKQQQGIEFIPKNLAKIDQKIQTKELYRYLYRSNIPTGIQFLDSLIETVKIKNFLLKARDTRVKI